MIEFIFFDQKWYFPHENSALEPQKICKSYFACDFCHFGARWLNEHVGMRVKISISENSQLLSFQTKKQNEFCLSGIVLTLFQKIVNFSKKLPIFADVSTWWVASTRTFLFFQIYLIGEVSRQNYSSLAVLVKK